MTVLTTANAFPGMPFPQHGINIPDQARSFNGSTDLINFGAVIAPTAITISEWIYPTAFPATYSATMIRNNSGAGGLYVIYLKSTGKLAYYVVAGVTLSKDPGIATLSLNTWYNVVMTYDSVGGLKTFVAGVSDGTTAANGSLNTTFSGALLEFGNDTVNAGRHFAGNAADLAIWNTVLTAPQIASLAAGRRANTIGANANLVGYWPILGDSPETDLSPGGGNNGVLTGTGVVTGPPSLDPVVFTNTVQSYLYPGAVLPFINPPPPSVLSIGNAFPNLAFPQHYATSNNARSFNGTTDLISLDAGFTMGTISAPSLPVPWSLGAWINLSNVNTIDTILGPKNVTTDGFQIRWNGASSTTGTLDLLKQNLTLIGSSSTITTSSGTWHHAGVTYDGTNFNFYWDGSNVGSGANAVSVTANAMLIGSRLSGGEHFGGSICDVALWSSVLTSGNFATLATPKRANQVGSPYAYWPLIGASPEPDFIPAGAFPGTLTGTAVVSGPSGMPALVSNLVQSFLYPGAVQPIVIVPPVGPFMIFSQQKIIIPLLMTVPVSVTLHNP